MKNSFTNIRSSSFIEILNMFSNEMLKWLNSIQVFFSNVVPQFSSMEYCWDSYLLYKPVILLFRIISIQSNFFLFSAARPRDFDGKLGTGLPVSMYTTKTPIDMWRYNFLNFYLYQRRQYTDNYFFKIKFLFFLYLLLSAS